VGLLLILRAAERKHDEKRREEWVKKKQAREQEWASRFALFCPQSSNASLANLHPKLKVLVVIVEPDAAAVVAVNIREINVGDVVQGNHVEELGIIPSWLGRVVLILVF